MKTDRMKRCLILLAVLVICAGAVWYFTNASAKPAEDAVLAYFQGNMNKEQRNAEKIGGEEQQRNVTEIGWNRRQEDMELPERQDSVWMENVYCDGGAKAWQAKSSI